MANVEFEEDTFDTKRPVNFGKQDVSGLVNLIMKIGLAKDEKQANYVLIAVAVCSAGAALYITASKLL